MSFNRIRSEYPTGVGLDVRQRSRNPGHSDRPLIPATVDALLRRDTPRIEYPTDLHIPRTDRKKIQISERTPPRPRHRFGLLLSLLLLVRYHLEHGVLELIQKSLPIYSRGHTDHPHMDAPNVRRQHATSNSRSCLRTIPPRARGSSRLLLGHCRSQTRSRRFVHACTGSDCRVQVMAQHREAFEPCVQGKVR